MIPISYVITCLLRELELERAISKVSMLLIISVNFAILIRKNNTLGVISNRQVLMVAPSPSHSLDICPLAEESLYSMTGHKKVKSKEERFFVYIQ